MKRLATSTGGFGIRVVNLETRLHEPFDVIDFGPGKIEIALQVDENRHPMAFQYLISWSGFFIDPQLVLQSRAAAANHPHAQTGTFFASLLHEVLDFFSSCFS